MFKLNLKYPIIWLICLLRCITFELNWIGIERKWIGIGIELKDTESDLNWNWIELKNPESNLNWNWIELKEMNWSEPWTPQCSALACHKLSNIGLSEASASNWLMLPFVWCPCTPSAVLLPADCDCLQSMLLTAYMYVYSSVQSGVPGMKQASRLWLCSSLCCWVPTLYMYVYSCVQSWGDASQ